MKGNPRRIWHRAIVVVLCATVASGAAGVAEGARRYGGRGDTILPGTVIGGIDVGSLTWDAARNALRREWEAPLDAPLTLSAGDHQETATPRELGVSTDLNRRIRDAIRTQARLFVFTRMWHRLTDRERAESFDVTWTIDRERLQAAVDGLAGRIDREPVDSAITFKGGTLHISDDRHGIRLLRAEAVEALEEALRRGTQAIDLPADQTPPQVRRSDHGTVLVVEVGRNRLSHYANGNLLKAYDVATGLPDHPTPQGEFRVINKRRNPTWVNPAPDGWGRALPRRIGPGRNNPLGTRALDLNSPGIRIHGTSDTGSIGFNASHGCVRMRMSDVEALFELVPVDTPVLIVRTAPDRIRPDRTRGNSPATLA